MNANTIESSELPGEDMYESEITRGSTGMRLLLTLLFAVIWSVTETVLAVVVIFSIIWALITLQAPPERVREFANTLVSYSYRVWRYMTYNEAQVPFPFSELPQALEPPSALGHDDADEVRELLGARDRDED